MFANFIICFYFYLVLQVEYLGETEKPGNKKLLIMRKRFLIEWIILLLVLIFIIPFLMIKISQSGDELFMFFRITIRYIIPLTIIFLLISQVWRKKKSEGLSNKETLKYFIPKIFKK